MMKRRILCAILIGICICVGGGLLSACKAKYKPIAYHFEWEENGDLQTIRERIVASNYNDSVDVEGMLADMQADGSFASVDYDSAMQDTWHPIGHLERLLAMQQAYHSPGHKHYHDPELAYAVCAGIKYWADQDFFCEWNWWWNEIGVGMYLPDILLFGVDGLDQATTQEMLQSLRNVTLQNEQVEAAIRQREVQSTGGNLTDKMEITLKLALLDGDGETVMWLRSLLANELRVFPMWQHGMHRLDAEGIKSDMSFHQHYQLLYFGGYGEVFCDGINRYLRLTADTQFALDVQARNVYADFILDGMQYAMRGEYRDIQASGRGIVREHELRGIRSQVIQACEILTTYYPDTARLDELSRLPQVRTLTDDAGAGGHKYFYQSDYQVYNGEKYMASVRHASYNTKIYETINGENPLGYYTGFGATFYYVDGDEYYDTPALWDWNRLPGTTTRQGVLPQYEDWQIYYKTGRTQYVGGVSDGQVGMSYFRQYDRGVSAKKAYFMFPDGVVCLGSDIQCYLGGEVVTGINQTGLDGDVVLLQDGKQTVMSPESETTGVFDAVWHDRIGYVTDHTVQVQAQTRSGDWNRISTRLASKPVTGGIFAIDMSHGVRPYGDSYAYTVLPDISVEQLQAYTQSPWLTVLANDPRVQAVADSHSSVVQAVFHRAGELTLPNGVRIQTDRGCVMIVRPVQDGYTITVASHDQTAGEMQLTCNGITKKITVRTEPVTVQL